MNSAIVVHPDFDHVWPWVADRMREIWLRDGPVQFVRLPFGQDPPVHDVLVDRGQVRRLAAFGARMTEESVTTLTGLRELAAPQQASDPLSLRLAEAGIRLIWHTGEGFWGQSVAEFALALTLGGLRRIPQTHHNILTGLDDWDYSQPDGEGRAGQRGMQYGDDSRFSNGTLEGKRVRVVGAGNIGTRFASFCSFLGADVAIWGPTASDPCFHLAGARREYFLERLVRDAEVFAPMLPLTPTTEGLVTAEHIRTLPKGCLVVMVTRARICDCDVLYERVLNNEIALAADVFDIEPLALGHSLLGRHNVVHTPHNAGRTKDANWSFAQMLADQFGDLDLVAGVL